MIPPLILIVEEGVLICMFTDVYKLKGVRLHFNLHHAMVNSNWKLFSYGVKGN